MSRFATIVPALGLAAALTPVGAEEIQFNRDVRPILSDKCFACHGFDAKRREAELRLDTIEGAMADHDGFRAIVPGDVSKSEMWARLNTDDEEDKMPPKKSHKEVTAGEKAVLKKWIEQGAKYQKHWSFEPPQRPALPAVKNEKWGRNAIDRFVLARLEKAGLEPAPEADRRTLARRVALDLTGLPPSPEMVEAFLNDAAPDAYEKLVAKLLASPSWGEHRARGWLDAARYADTHGLHFDNYREMWPYRDWVIAAFNRNEPFDQFTLEQIAGDLLPNPTQEQLIATGFHRCNSTTNEGGTIDDETIAFYTADRVTTTSWVFLGLTANCATCHDHKFDPITQKDFYAMGAYFRNTTQPIKDGNVKDTKPVLYLPPNADEKRYTELNAEIPKLRDEQTRLRGEVEKKFEPWLASVKPDALEVSPQKLVLQAPMADGKGDEVAVEIACCTNQIKASAPLAWQDGGKLGKAPVFGKDVQIDLGNEGNFEKDQQFTVSAWVKVPKDVPSGAIVARFDDRGAKRQGWVLYFEGKKFGVRLASPEPASEVRVVSKKESVKAGEWQHVAFTYGGQGATESVALYVGGKPVPMVAPPAAKATKDQPAGPPNGKLLGSMRANVSLRLGRREVASPFTGGQMQDVRVYSDKLSPAQIGAIPQEKALRTALAAGAKRTPEQKKALHDFYMENGDPAVQALTDRMDDMEDELTAIQGRSAVTHIQQERMDHEAMSHILIRGQYDKPGEEVKAMVFSALHPLPANAPHNRLGLGEWLIAKDNPLTARVTVNRFWQEVFGTGLVRTSEDFGAMGETPSNQELLDWLAVEFRESGWDVKKLFTLVVTSSTYRQSAVTTPLKLERDPADRLFSRGPRFRMEAEMVRDYALAASGLLSPKIGGPSVKPYQPEGVWEAVAITGSTTRFYKQDTGESLYRRSLYTFWKRSAPPANMDVFNAPSRESCTVRRERTNTPLQALVTMNDPQFVEAGRKLAELALKQGGNDPAKAIDVIAARVLLRPLRPEEKEIISGTYADLERQFAQTPERAKELIAVGESKSDPALPAPQLAAMAMVANQVLCLDEALNK